MLRKLSRCLNSKHLCILPLPWYLPRNQNCLGSRPEVIQPHSSGWQRSFHRKRTPREWVSGWNMQDVCKKNLLCSPVLFTLPSQSPHPQLPLSQVFWDQCMDLIPPYPPLPPLQSRLRKEEEKAQRWDHENTPAQPMTKADWGIWTYQTMAQGGGSRMITEKATADSIKPVSPQTVENVVIPAVSLLLLFSLFSSFPFLSIY